MAEKKFFVDINLQGSALTNAKIGTNTGIGSTEGAFGYDSAAHRLQYFDGTATKDVANLSDIAAVTGGLIFQGGYDPTTNTPDITDGSALKGFFWAVTAAGTFLGESVQVGDSIVAKVDNAGTTLSDWLILQGNIVIATDSVDGISRLATQAEADAGTEGGAVVITPATLQGKIDAQVTPEINNKLPLAGGTMSGDIVMNGNNINSVNSIWFSDPNSTIYDLDTLKSNYAYLSALLPKAGNTEIGVGSTLNLSENGQIKGLLAPTDGTDATNKTYVDDQDALKVSKSGDTMSGNLDMDGSQILNATISGATLGNDLKANDNRITNLLAPVDGGDATNKTYVDNAAATAESNANAYTDAKTTEINILTSDWQSDTNDFYAVLNLPFATGKAIASFFIEDFSVEFGYYNNGGTQLVVRTNILPSSTVNARLQKIG